MLNHVQLRKWFQWTLLSLFTFCIIAGTQAQNNVVTGTVTDASDGMGIPGATVVVKGTTTGTATDIDGKFSITIQKPETLVISYVGYVTQELAVSPGEKLDVSLEAETALLDELVVIGYGTVKKDDATGSVAAIDSRDFNQGLIAAPSDLIAGKIPGVVVTNGGGAPGSETQIRIRGGSSLTASNDPLIVIDGVPVENTDINGMRNPLNSINPNDIETFTVLKDASATAIYGSRASNGVILITTKKGKIGSGIKPISLSYSGNFSISQPGRRIDALNSSEFSLLMNEQFPGDSNRLKFLGSESTNWQDQIFRSSFGMDHHISAAGAVKWLPYRISLGYTNQDGILKTDNLERTTASVNLNPKFFKDHLAVNLNAKYVNVQNKFADRGAIGAAIQFDPTKPVNSETVPVFDNQGSVSDVPNQFGNYWYWTQPNNFAPSTTATSNPVAILNQRDDQSDVNRFIGNIMLDYKFHFLPELRANLNLAMDQSSSDGSIFVDTTAAFAYNAEDGGGIDRVYTQDKKMQLLEFFLNYDRRVEQIDSRFELTGGYSYQYFKDENTSFETNVRKTRVEDSVVNAQELVLISFFGRLNYTFKDRYLLTLTLRNDQSSRFSKSTRSGIFPAVAFAWKIHDERWMGATSNVLSQLKLRLGWGITGQQDIGNSFYPYMPIYTISEPDASYIIGGDTVPTLRPNRYDENIKWEETTTWNVGFDFGFADNRYYGSLDFYYRKTTDLLNEIPVPAGSNFSNRVITNIGDLENRGVEFSIFTRPIVTNNLQWEIGFNTAYNQNEILKLNVFQDSSFVGVEAGGISGAVGNNIQIQSEGYPSNSFYVYEQVYDENGNPLEGIYVDRNGDGIISLESDRYQYKQAAPDVTFGLFSSLFYKNWTFAFSGRASFGNYVYNNVSSENGNYQRLYRPEGPYISNVTSDALDVNFNNPQYFSNYYVQNGAFFRMDYIRLGYQFTDLIANEVDLGLSFTVNNAFLITDYKGIDPEISNGIDNNIYPRPRIFVLGVNLMF